MQTQEKPNLQMIAKNFQTYKHMKKKTFKHMPKPSKHTIAILFTDAVWCGMRCTQVDCQQRQQIGVSSLEPSYIDLLKKLSTQQISQIHLTMVFQNLPPPSRCSRGGDVILGIT